MTQMCMCMCAGKLLLPQLGGAPGGGRGPEGTSITASLTKRGHGHQQQHQHTCRPALNAGVAFGMHAAISANAVCASGSPCTPPKAPPGFWKAGYVMSPAYYSCTYILQLCPVSCARPSLSSTTYTPRMPALEKPTQPPLTRPT